MLGEEQGLPLARLDEGVVVELAHRVALLLHRRPLPPSSPPPHFALVGESDRILAVRQAIARAATLEAPVLLTGETGTGKELVARALHQGSHRRRGPFITVNLGALSPSLAVAELFGARKGSFTGSVMDQPGFFARADGGTLFLDEVGEAPLEVQVALLRTLETGEISPVGGQRARRVDVRVISATDADLAQRIHDGDFRAPLLHRLAGYPIPLPPLRRRRDDLGLLLVHFLRRELERMGEPPLPRDPETRLPWLPAPLVAHLARQDWPGNVRQLENTARQLIIDNRGQPSLSLRPGRSGPTTLFATEPDPPSTEEPPATPRPTAAPRRRLPSEVSEDELLAALREHRWELKAAAKALGIARTSLYDLLRRSSRIRSAADVPAEEIRGSFERHAGEVEAMVEDLEISERALRQRLKDLGLR
jgi:two-component system nitrogen regulation response regulator GlnG